MGILEKLYHDLYEPNAPYRPEMREIYERYDAAWEKAEALLGDGLSHELLGSILELMDAEACNDFKEGFRLGVQFMYELLLTP